MTAKKPQDVDDGGGAIVVDGRNYIPVDPPTRPPAPPAELHDDQDDDELPEPRFFTDDVKKDSDSEKDGKPTRTSAQQARMVPGKPLLTIVGGSLGTFVPMVAQAASGWDLLLLGGGTAAAAGTGFVLKASKGRKARRNGAGRDRSRGAGAASNGPGGRGGLLRSRDRSGNGARSGGTTGGRGTSRRAASGSGGGRGTGPKLGGLLKRKAGSPGGSSSKLGGLFKRKAGSPGGGSGSKAGGLLKRKAGSPDGGSGRLRNALNRSRAAAARSGPDATNRKGKGSTPRTRTGRAASAALRGTGRGLGAVGRGLGRAGMSPFRAIGQGVKGARKSNGWGDAVRRSRKQTKKHRRNNDRSWHPFAGWGAAFAGVGAYGATRIGRLLRGMWKWNPPGMYDADGEPAARIIGDKVREDPNAPKQPTTSSTSDGGSPIVVAPPPVQRIGNGTAHTPRPGGATMSDSNLVLHATAMKNEAGRRANVGARKGILEVVDDSKRFGVALDLVTQALHCEVQAVKRFPFHTAVQAAYDSALAAMANASKVMVECASAIETIHRQELEELRNPKHQNAQMWDQTMNNGARGGA